MAYAHDSVLIVRTADNFRNAFEKLEEATKELISFI